MAQHYKEDRFNEYKHSVETERVENYDCIYIHDAAVMNHFSFWTLIQDQNTRKLIEKRIPQVFATPRREWSVDDVNNPESQERRTAMEWVGDYDPTQIERISYPSIAVSRIDAQFDQQRWTYAPWRKILYSSDLNLVLESNFPLPYNFSYQFDFWVLEQQHLNMMMEQWARLFFRPTIPLDVHYPYPWGVQNVHVQQQGSFSNISTLETGEEQRELRGVATMNVMGWIPLPAKWVRTVQQVTVDIIEESSQEILLTMETERANKKIFKETGDKEQVLVWK